MDVGQLVEHMRKIGNADVVVGVKVDLLVFDRFPDAFGEDFVAA